MAMPATGPVLSSCIAAGIPPVLHGGSRPWHGRFSKQSSNPRRNWRYLVIEGSLDFSLVGVLASISGALARQGISIFVISTYDTDYLLVKEQVLDQAVDTLIREGHRVITD
ncbi:MAG TPA: ACT domain-containing protein [Clostridia bacterium]|nr:ACT domain-containing protein [Clostridia bacterium]